MTGAGAGPVARNDTTEEFFDAADRGVLVVRRCPAGHFSGPPARRCEVCGSGDLSYVPATGRARLVSWAVVHHRDGGRGLPAIVELEEGPWWWTMLVGADPGDLREGTALRVLFQRPDGSEAVPVFEPA